MNSLAEVAYVTIREWQWIDKERRKKREQLNLRGHTDRRQVPEANLCKCFD